MQVQDDCLVLSNGGRHFLEIVILHLWMCFHNNPRLRSIHAGPPRSGSAYYLAILIEFLRILAEIPDVSALILCEIVKRILLQDAIHKNFVMDDPAGYSINNYRSVCNRELISELTPFLNPLIDENSARFYREKRIVDCGREIRGRRSGRGCCSSRCCGSRCRRSRGCRRSSRRSRSCWGSCRRERRSSRWSWCWRSSCCRCCRGCRGWCRSGRRSRCRCSGWCRTGRELEFTNAGMPVEAAGCSVVFVHMPEADAIRRIDGRH